MQPVTGVLASLLVLSATAASSAAQTKPASWTGTVPSAKPVKRSSLPVSEALSALQFTQADLPAGLTLADGLLAASREMHAYFDNPGIVPLLDAPIARAAQTVKAGTIRVGSLAAFEFSSVVSPSVLSFLRSFFRGPARHEARHPEEILANGRFLVISTLGDRGPHAAWFRDELRFRLARLVPHKWAELESLLAEASAAGERRDAHRGFALLAADAARIAGCAQAQLLLAEFAAATADWTFAAEAFGRTLELHDTGTDPLPEAATLWAAVDGRSACLMHLGQDEGALPLLERGVELARSLGDDKRTARSLYALARGLVRLHRVDDGYGALAESLRLAPERKAMAARDADFDLARQRADFRQICAR